MAGGRAERVDQIFFEDFGGPPVEEGQMVRNGTVMEVLIDGQVKDIGAAAGTGISESTHKTLNQLIHFIDEGPAEGFATGATKTVTGTVFPTKIEWKRSDATLLVEKTIAYTGAFPTTITWKVYDTDGTTLLATVTDTISYSGPFETGRTRAIT